MNMPCSLFAFSNVDSIPEWVSGFCKVLQLLKVLFTILCLTDSSQLTSQLEDWKLKSRDHQSMGIPRHKIPDLKKPHVVKPYRKAVPETGSVQVYIQGHLRGSHTENLVYPLLTQFACLPLIYRSHIHYSTMTPKCFRRHPPVRARHNDCSRRRSCHFETVTDRILAPYLSRKHRITESQPR